MRSIPVLSLHPEMRVRLDLWEGPEKGVVAVGVQVHHDEPSQNSKSPLEIGTEIGFTRDSPHLPVVAFIIKVVMISLFLCLFVVKRGC